VKIPNKKPKEEELSGSQKEYNKKLRRERVVSEHTTGKMKKYEIMGPKFNDTVASIAGVFVNFMTMNFSESISTE